MTWEQSSRVVVAGIGYSAIERRSTNPIGSFALEAAYAALEDSGLDASQIDGLATYPTAPFAGSRDRDGEDVVKVDFFMSPHMKMPIKWYCEANEGMQMTAIRDAVIAVAAGACNYALIWRAMYVPAGLYHKVEAKAVGGDGQFMAPYGMGTGYQWHAVAYREYLERYGQSREKMAALVLSSRRNANLNSHAIFADRLLTEEDYLTARMISDPLCLFDCDVPVTACLAAILTTADRAKDLRQRPVYVAGAAQQTTVRPSIAISYTLHDHIKGGAPMVQDLWDQSGLSAKDMSAAELYDGFSPSTLYWLEAAGFCGRGEALDYIQDGRITLEGELPVNTFGGSLSQGRLHGMGHFLEAVGQLRGTADEARQLRDPKAILITDGSPMRRSSGLVLTSEPTK